MGSDRTCERSWRCKEEKRGGDECSSWKPFDEMPERSEKQRERRALVIREEIRAFFSEEAFWDGIQDVEMVVAIQFNVIFCRC